MALRNQPYIPLYVQDYLTDEKLNECSPAAQGIYIKIMCILHKSEAYGSILLKQKDKQNENSVKNFAFKIARLLPFREEEIESALSELIENGVMNIEGDTLFQKRMVRDGELSDKRALAGSKGGNSKSKQGNLLKQKDKQNENKCLSKNEANSEYENEYEIDNEYVNKDIPNKKDINALFETLWQMYPIKKGKGSISDSQKKKLYSIGLEEMTRAINRYYEDNKNTDKQYWKHGSTFFNSGYIDYLDENYEDKPCEEERKGSESEYDYDKFFVN